MHAAVPDRSAGFDLETRDVPATGAVLSAHPGWTLTEPRRLRAAAILNCGEHPVGSLGDPSNPIYPVGISEHVARYLAVDDLTTRTRAALDARARLVVEPFELPGPGAMSTIIDPLGGPITLWEQRGFLGWTPRTRGSPDPRAPRHHGPDLAAAAAFSAVPGLDEPEAHFVPGSTATWVARVAALPSGSVRTPGGTDIHGA